ncbi:hypothetical protein Hanom_Chr16g01415881 [Helianthus anomalus]
MELTTQMKMARFQTFWIQMRKNKPFDESRKSSETSGTKITFYSSQNIVQGIKSCPLYGTVAQC